MSVYVTWSIEGEKQLSRALRGFADGVRDFRNPLTSASSKLKKTFSTESFSTQGTAVGAQRWERLSPYTVAQKARQGFPADPLIRTGKMKKSFMTLVTSNEAVIYNDAEYFGYHQSNQPRRKLPRRVMMALGNNQREMIVKEFQKYLQKLGS